MKIIFPNHTLLASRSLSSGFAVGWLNRTRAMPLLHILLGPNVQSGVGQSSFYPFCRAANLIVHVTRALSWHFTASAQPTFGSKVGKAGRPIFSAGHRITAHPDCSLASGRSTRHWSSSENPTDTRKKGAPTACQIWAPRATLAKFDPIENGHPAKKGHRGRAKFGVKRRDSRCRLWHLAARLHRTLSAGLEPNLRAQNPKSDKESVRNILLLPRWPCPQG
jgi:hypothetical protein